MSINFCATVITPEYTYITFGYPAYISST